MNIFGATTENGRSPSSLDVVPPFVWPESRWHTGQCHYEHEPPIHHILKQADFVTGIVVDASDGAIEWISAVLSRENLLDLRLILLVYPTCSTRPQHLQSLLETASQSNRPVEKIQLKVLTTSSWTGLPPTAVLAHVADTGESCLCLGSVGDVGRQQWHHSSLNLAFRPDDKLRGEFRRWLNYLWASASPLTPETTEIPHLVVPKGDPKAWALWVEYQRLCANGKDQSPEVAVDPQTGEVTTIDGKSQAPEETCDGTVTQLDPLAVTLNDVYSRASLVTVDETTRIRPLAVPVKATLLGQESESETGAVKHKQQFSLAVLDPDTAKKIDKYRRVTDVMELLSYPLSKGNRLIPDQAKALLEKELEKRNQNAEASLKKQLSGRNQQAGILLDNTLENPMNDRVDDRVKAFIESRKKEFRNNLDKKYQELGQGQCVPEDKLRTILGEVEDRITRALSSRITPKVNYNRLAPPDLTIKAPDDNWGQAFSLLLRAATQFRKSRTDPYFSRKFSSLSFDQKDYERAMDIFGDTILRSHDADAAKTELEELDKIKESNAPLKEKCRQIYGLISKKSDYSHMEP